MGFAGLIASVMGGAAEGANKAAEAQHKKNLELDIRKEMLLAEEEKQMRVDEITRGRDRAEEARKMSPEYLQQVGAANLTKGTIEAGNRKTLAPLGAEAATAEYTAGKPLKDTQTTDAIQSEILKTTTLANDKDYVAGKSALSKAEGAASIEAQRMRTEGMLNRQANAGGGAGGKAPKAETTADLDRIVKRSEADAARVMGVDRKDFNSAYARLSKKTDPASIALLEKVQPYVEELNDASSRLKNWKAGAPQSGAPNKKPAGNRPSLNTFDLED
jgi:hypothetical protein